MYQKKRLAAAAALAVLIAVFAGVWFGTRPTPETGDKHITVEVVHRDESSKLFPYDTDAEYLGELLLEEGLIQGEEGAYGLYITVVDGEQAIFEQDGAYWAFYQGEDYAALGVDQTPIHDGDVFRLVYTYG